jgi:ribosomal protein S18 acetylase RimI-like enzyme
MNIRLLTHEDTEIFRTLRINAVVESPSAFAESISEVTEKSHADFSAQLDSHGRGDFVLGAFDDASNLIGIVGFYRAVHEKKRHKGTLWGMYVTPEKRKQNIGSELVSALIEHTKNLSCITQIVLCVTTTNEAAKRLYESKGFQIYGVEHHDIHIDGVYLDEALMQLWIPTTALLSPADQAPEKRLS